MYPMRGHSNNLQKIETGLFVKNNIVLTIPNCPTYSRNPHTDLDLVSLSIPFSQVPNILVIFEGKGIL
jgi:hypothetical protein